MNIAGVMMESKPAFSTVEVPEYGEKADRGDVLGLHHFNKYLAPILISRFSAFLL